MTTANTGSAQAEKIAVITIHGVADQRLGETARTLAELLVAQGPNGASYAPAMQDELMLQVPSIMPLKERAKLIGGVATKAVKYLKQSMGSDFVRHGQTTAGHKRSLLAAENALTPGADFSDYLLDKAQQNDTPTNTYAAPRVSLHRSTPDTSRKVDIYEMYWADLSRLSGKVPRILTELFTLLFRLSELGRDTVQSAAAEFAQDKSWWWLSRLQTGLDWAYSRLLALLFLQLMMLALVVLPLGWLSDKVASTQLVLSILLGVGTLLGVAYFKRRFAVGILLGIAVGAAASQLVPGQWLIGIVWLSVLSYPYDLWLKTCAERFRLVRVVGWVLWGLLLLSLITVAACHQSDAGIADNAHLLDMWALAVFRAIEYVLVVVLAWWVVVGLALPVWMSLGMVAARRGFHARASVATGRLGLVISLGFFLVLTMSGWALLNMAIKPVVAQYHYTPVIFTGVSLSDLNRHDCFPDATTAGCFLQDRFVNSTETFSIVAVLLLSLVAYLLIAFVPSVLSELQVVKDKSERLGRWLTGGYRQLDNVVAGVVWCGSLCALSVGMLLLYARMMPIGDWLNKLDFLSLAVYTAGTATVTFTTIGGLLSRYVPSLRAPLDAGLDVDNHFREFPRRAIPRAQIFSRYIALLKHVGSQGYDRIVIVSHSQGTVITAELLRYMKERAALRPADDIAHLWQGLHGKLKLLTAGSPLRQLYAARFPVIYDWVLGSSVAGTMGPTAGDVGVNVWINLYATGDYVGRWLWSRPPIANGDDICPQIDSDSAGHNKYRPDMHLPSTLPPAATTQDVSLGAGAHTHYFDKDNGKVAPKVASVIDMLVAGTCP